MATSLSTYGPPCSTSFLRPIRAHNPNGIPISSAVFAQTTVECPYTLQWDAHSPKKNLPLPMGGSGPPSNTWFPGPTQFLNPKGSSIGAAVFAGLTSVTDRPRYSVGKNRPSTYVVLRCGLIIVSTHSWTSRKGSHNFTASNRLARRVCSVYCVLNCWHVT